MCCSQSWGPAPQSRDQIWGGRTDSGSVQLTSACSSWSMIQVQTSDSISIRTLHTPWLPPKSACNLGGSDFRVGSFAELLIQSST